MDKQEKQARLDKIAREIERCEVCKIGKIGKAVPGEGNPDADIVFLGEAPGKQEAETGRPFIGRAGKVLRELIKDAGLKEADVYITSPVKYLPEYVTPKPPDIEHGRMHLGEQLAVIEPKIVVLMGNTAVQAVLQKRVPIAKEHGKVVEQDGVTYLIAYHPAAPLYAPKVRNEIVKDFKKLKSIVQRTNKRQATRNK